MRCRPVKRRTRRVTWLANSYPVSSLATETASSLGSTCTFTVRRTAGAKRATAMKWSVTMDSNNRNTAKLLAAIVGASAMVTMGAVAVSTHQQPADTHNLAAGTMNKAA